MATRPQTGKRPVYTQEYFVYDPNCTTLGGIVVKERDGKKVVVLQPTQAQFFLDQGLIGKEALDQRSDASRKVMDQFMRKPIDQQGQAQPQAAPQPQTSPQQAKIKREAPPQS